MVFILLICFLFETSRAGVSGYSHGISASAWLRLGIRLNIKDRFYLREGSLNMPQKRRSIVCTPKNPVRCHLNASGLHDDCDKKTCNMQFSVGRIFEKETGGII